MLNPRAKPAVVMDAMIAIETCALINGFILNSMRLEGTVHVLRVCCVLCMMCVC